MSEGYRSCSASLKYCCSRSRCSFQEIESAEEKRGLGASLTFHVDRVFITAPFEDVELSSHFSRSIDRRHSVRRRPINEQQLKPVKNMYYA